MSVKLVHGLKDGKVVKVTDVGVGSGLACNCICLDCEAVLIAINKVENSQRPHFRHYSSTISKEITACNASQETAIHYLAKEIIEKNKSIILPSYSVCINKHNGNGKRTHLIKEKKFVTFDYVKNENSISTSQGFQDIRPDFIAYAGNRRLFIEIAVSHQADENKIERLKELNVSAIEIDLSKFDRTANEEELEKYIEEKAPKKWLYHVKHEEYYQKALEEEQEKAKLAALYAEKEDRERKIREEQQRKNEVDRQQIKFGSDFENIILNRRYRGDLFSRVEQFIQSEYKQSINCYYRKGTPYVEHEIAELEDVIIYETVDNFQVECEFIGLTFNISIESQLPAHKFGYLVISSIYYQASKLLCNDLESKVLNQEIEFERKAKEIEEQRKAWDEKSKQEAIKKEERSRQEALENEARRRIEEERRRKARELQRKENEKRKNDEENLVYKTIMKTYETKKKCEQWKKEHPVMPEEIIKQVKIEIPRFNTESFIDIRRRLQNKGKLIKVVENKLPIAAIVK